MAPSNHPVSEGVLGTLRRLSVTLTVSFKPAEITKAIVRGQRFTFTTAPKPITAHRRRPRG